MKKTSKYLAMAFCFFLLCGNMFAQTTEFSYQGSLKDGANPATGNYDFEFALFDSVAAGGQIGSTLTRSTVAVAGGVFTVSLDFGAAQFPGANRFLEIRGEDRRRGSIYAVGSATTGQQFALFRQESYRR